VSAVWLVQNNLRVRQGTTQATATGTTGGIGIGSTIGATSMGLSGERSGTTDTSRRKTGATT
jgi:hypothetical protein